MPTKCNWLMVNLCLLGKFRVNAGYTPVPYNVDEEKVLNEESMYPIACGNHVTDGGSTFTGYAASVSDLDELATLPDRLLLLDGEAEATHRMYAYIIDNSHAIMDNFDADEDHGIGLETIKSSEKWRHLICILFSSEILMTSCIKNGQKRCMNVYIYNKT